MFQDKVAFKFFKFHGLDFGKDHGLDLLEEYFMLAIVVAGGLQAVLGVFPRGDAVSFFVRYRIGVAGQQLFVRVLVVA